MKSIIKYFITLTGLLFWAIGLHAQQTADNTAMAGDKAIFIYDPFLPVSPKYPQNGITGFSIEREDIAAPGKWQMVTQRHTPQNEVELYQAFTASFRFFPEGRSIQFDVKRSWANFAKNKFLLDSLKTELAFTPLQMAYGILSADTGVVLGHSYRYRVSQTGAGGQAFFTNTVAYPAKVNAIKPRFLTRSTDPKVIRLRWFAKGNITTHRFKVYRKASGEKAFTEIDAFVLTSTNADTLKYDVTDEHVAYTTLYQYYIVPVNSFGGGGNIHSDTIPATCMQPQNLLNPQYFIAAGDAKLKAIKLKYQLPEPGLAGSVSVMRSVKYENGYEQIGVATPNDTTYIDRRIEPGQKYYYYLQMIDKLGRPGLRSAKTFGLYQSTKNDATVDGLTAIQKGKVVMLTWQHAVTEPISGYYVYRSEGVGMPLKRLTTLIAKPDSTYTDNYQFKPGITYGYSVRSENTSNIESHDSKIIYIKPTTADTGLVAPKNVQALVQNNAIRLMWFSTQRFNPGQTGYSIWRRATGDKAFTLLKAQYPLSATSFLDTTVMQGVSYIYEIASTNAKSSSVKTESNDIAIALTKYPTPVGLTALNGPTGVLISWGKVIDGRIKHFDIYRYIRGGVPQVITSVNASNTSFLDKTALPGKRYYYFVRSTGANPAAASVNSNEAFVNR